MMDECRARWASLFALIVVVSAVAATPTTKPADKYGGLRLDGTFIQYQTWMMKLDAAAWRRELQALQRAQLRTIVIQLLEHDDISFIPSDKNAPDPTEIILQYADYADMPVWVGLATDRGWWKGTNDPVVLDRISDRCVSVAERAWSRYGKHKSLVGWYIPSEPWDTLAPEDVPRLRTFLRKISDACKRVSGGKPVSFAPFLTGKADAAVFGKTYADLLTDAGIDVCMLQDGIGPQRWKGDVYPVKPLFRAARDACVTAGVELWADVEIFQAETVVQDGKKSRKVVASDTRWLAKQLTAEAPFVSKFIAFDCFHYMSPSRGEPQKQFYEAYLREFVDRPFWPVYGPSVTVDPSFPYYRDRSVESIAAEIRANGYSIIHYIAEPAGRVQPKLVKALHAAGIGVWYQAFAHTTYNSGGLPKQWPKWRMVSRHELAGGKWPEGFVHLCPSNLEYREWKKLDMAAALRAAPFDAIEIVEAHWPEYPGVDAFGYSCFCDACRQAFCKMFPEEQSLPDVIKKDSPLSPDRNRKLWGKWLKFRVASMTAFVDDLVNGKGGLRESSPGVPVCVWGYGLAERDAIKRVRKDSGLDAGNVAKRVRPDAYCIQTHWPDWMRANLPADYVTQYQPFFEQVRQASPSMPLMVQADIGSTRDAIRDRVWVEKFEAACYAAGVESTTLYEYFIAGWTYREPPRVVRVVQKGSTIELCFTRRLDPASVTKPEAITVQPGRIREVQVDGNVVRLVMNGSPQKGAVITVDGVVTDAGRRLFADVAVFPPTKEQIRLR